MKKLIWLTPILLLTAIWISGQGCSNAPSSPSPAATDTPVPAGPTNTATNSPTITPTTTTPPTATNSPTNSPTDTPSNTTTPVPTSTATDSPTITPTGTPTNSPTETPTNSATNSPTNSPTTTPTRTPTATPAPCTLLLNDFETTTENGNWSSSSGAALSLSTLNATHGSYSLDCNLSGSGTWQNFLNIDNFFPNTFTNATQVVVDLYVDSSVVTGTGWGNQLVLQATGGGQFNQNISADTPTLVAGAQSVTFAFNYAAGAIPNGSALTKLHFNYNEGSATSGNIYIDNLRVNYSAGCPTVPPSVLGWTFEGNSLTDSYGTWSTIGGGDKAVNATVNSPGFHGSYALDVTATFSAANQTAGALLYPNSPIDGSGFNGIRASMWIDSSCDGSGGYPGGVIQLGDNTNYPLTSWQNMTQDEWITIDFPASTWGTFVKSNITMIKVYTNLGGSIGALGTGHVRFDNIEFY